MLRICKWYLSLRRRVMLPYVNGMIWLLGWLLMVLFAVATIAGTTIDVTIDPQGGAWRGWLLWAVLSLVLGRRVWPAVAWFRNRGSSNA